MSGRLDQRLLTGWAFSNTNAMRRSSPVGYDSLHKFNQLDHSTRIPAAIRSPHLTASARQALPLGWLSLSDDRSRLAASDWESKSHPDLPPRV